jgi:hypothetical protein
VSRSVVVEHLIEPMIARQNGQPVKQIGWILVPPPAVALLSARVEPMGKPKCQTPKLEQPTGRFIGCLAGFTLFGGSHRLIDHDQQQPGEGIGLGLASFLFCCCCQGHAHSGVTGLDLHGGGSWWGFR